jgi:hypothetical protein
MQFIQMVLPFQHICTLTLYHDLSEISTHNDHNIDHIKYIIIYTSTKFMHISVIHRVNNIRQELDSLKIYEKN